MTTLTTMRAGFLLFWPLSAVTSFHIGIRIGLHFSIIPEEVKFVVEMRSSVHSPRRVVYARLGLSIFQAAKPIAISEKYIYGSETLI